MTTNRLKKAIIAHLEIVKPDEDITVSDATQREQIQLPCLAVGIAGAERHSVALQGVQKCQVEITLRCHAGDEAEANVDEWVDRIETALNDPSEIKALLDEGIRMDFWDYHGATTEWDGSVMETTFAAESWVVRV
jgi:hypothetical protein